MALVVRSSQPLAKVRRQLGNKELSRYQWILPDTRARLFGRAIEQFAKEGIQALRSVVNTASISATKALEMMSNRIAIVPLHVFDNELRDGTAARLRGEWPMMKRDFYLYSCAREGPSATRANLFRAFSECLKRTGPAHASIS